jgi:hypothetical protein
MPKTGASLELMGGFALQGLTAVRAIDLSTGSANWPALVGMTYPLRFLGEFRRGLVAAPVADRRKPPVAWIGRRATTSPGVTPRRL